MSYWRAEARWRRERALEEWPLIKQEEQYWWFTSKAVWHTDKETSMKNFTDVELAELADWAEAQERVEAHPDAKKAFGAIRQGADWLIRYRIKQAQQKLELAGKPVRTGQTQ